MIEYDNYLDYYRNDARETMREREKNTRKLEIEKELREKEMRTIKY